MIGCFAGQKVTESKPFTTEPQKKQQQEKYFLVLLSLWLFVSVVNGVSLL
jgi:hypothetical protein